MNCTKCGKIIDDDSKFCIFCGTTQHRTDLNYDKGRLIPFEKDNKWGFKDLDTRDIVVPAKYQSVDNFTQDRAVVKFNNKYSFVDQNGHELTPFKYDFAQDFIEGFAKVKCDERWSFVDKNGKEIAPFKYTSIDNFIGGLAKVELNGMYSLINEQGIEVTPLQYSYISNFNEKIAIVKKDDKYGLINIKGNEILPCIYEQIRDFKGSIARVTKEFKDGLINERGEIVLPCEYEKIEDYYKNGAIIIKDNKYGYINCNGVIIVPCIYEYLSVLDDGNLVAKQEKTWRCFDKNGVDVSDSSRTFKMFLKRKRGKRVITFILLLVSILTILLVYDFASGEIGIAKEIQYWILGKDEVDWRHAIKINNSTNIDAYVNYVSNHPNGKYSKEANNIIETFFWENAQSENTIESYTFYITKYPNGKYSNEAQELLGWMNAVKSNTIESFETYILRFKNGNHIRTAEENIEQLYWDKAIEPNQIYYLNEYFEKYPEGKHRLEAEELIAWYNANSTNTFESYKEYLIHYSNGNNFQEAINSLLVKLTCIFCNGSGICYQCKGSGVYGKEQKLISDPCPNRNRVFHGKNCKLCGGDGRINEKYVSVDSQCNKCNGTGKCNNCDGMGKTQNEWLNAWYANKISCLNCKGTGYVTSYDSFYKKPCPSCNLILNKN